MTVLTPGKTLRSRGPELLVENAFATGRYVFELVVIDDQANESEPARLTVTVAAPAPVRPTRPVTPPILDVQPLRPVQPARPIVRPR